MAAKHQSFYLVASIREALKEKQKGVATKSIDLQQAAGQEGQGADMSWGINCILAFTRE